MWRHEAVDNVEDLVFGDIYHHTYDDSDCDGLPMHSYISLATSPANNDYGVACLVVGLPGNSLWTHPESTDVCHVWWEPDD